MVRVNFITKMVAVMMAIGNITKCKVMVHCTTNLTQRLMKGTG